MGAPPNLHSIVLDGRPFGTSLSDYLLRDITRLAERPPVADVIIRAGSRSGGADIDLIVETVRSGRDRP